mmetsp:Transcript_4140/g.9849  ORF Transcript_4140/g.9849 Transcript_4140/m.9849 type:complete len:287 (+) Transcript_4140:61-921(+)
MMKSASLLLSVAGLCLLNTGSAFVPKGTVGMGRVSTSFSNKEAPTTTAIGAVDAAMISEMETARAAFVLCLAGALGTAAVGREVIPVTLREWKKVNALKGQGYSSMSGEKLDLVGYPDDVYSDDVMAIINNNMTVYDIVDEYPIEGQLPGYLRFESLQKANPDVSQVAVRAIFDSIAVGVNKNSVAPRIAAEKFELYKQEGLESLTKNSRLSKTIGVSALVVLLTLLGSADYFALFHLFHGWFPEWSGTARLPFSLLDFPAYLELPSHFMNDVPQVPIADGAFPMN